MSRRLRFQLSECSKNVYPGEEVEDPDLNNGEGASRSKEIVPQACAGVPYFPAFSLLLEDDLLIRAIICDDIRSLHKIPRRCSSSIAKSRDGTPALHLATSLNNRAIMKLLIDEGSDVNATADAGQFKGLSPLHVASTQGHMSAFNLLLDHGANLSTRTTSSVSSPWSPDQNCLHLATKRNHTYLCNVMVSMTKELVDCPDKEGLTPLHLTCILGHTNLVRLFLRSWCDANARDKKQLTPLVYAMMKRHISVAQLLIGKTDLSLRYDLGHGKGLTALHVSTSLYQAQLTESLIAAGCDPNVSCTCYPVSKWRIQNEALLPLHIASLQGDVRTFEVLKDVTSEIVSRNSRVTTLTIAVASERYQMVRYLLSCGFDPTESIRVLNVSHYTPLHIAAELGLVDIVEQLLIHKADPNAQTLTRLGLNDSTPLHLACQKQNTSLVNLLITKRNIRLKDSRGMVPLHIAASTGCCEIAGALLKMEHNCISDWTDSGSLSKAAFVDLESDNESVCRKEVETLPPSRTADKEGKLPIHLAAVNKHIAVLETFLECREVIDSVDISGKHLLHLAAADAKIFSVLWFLLSQNLDRHVKDDFGFLPLHIAAERNNTKAVKALLFWEDTPSISHNIEDLDRYFLRQVLETPSASVDITNRDKQTALHIAARGGYSAVVECLLLAGADVNASDNAGVTPLHLACSMGNAVVRQLMDAGSNPNAVCQWTSKQHFSDFTPLHLAILEKEVQTVRLLVDQGADVNAQFKGTYSEFQSPLFLAISQKEWDIVNLLIRKGSSVKCVGNHQKPPLIMLMDFQGPIKTQKLLLSFGANTNSMASNAEAHAPLERVLCFTPHSSDLRLLLDWGADINMVKPNGCTVLHDVVKYLSSKPNNCTGALEEFLKLTQSVRNSMMASEIKGLDSVADKYVCNFNATAPNGETILYTAANGRSVFCLELILKHWSKPAFTIVNGDTLLRLAVTKRSPRVVRLLLESGIDLNDKEAWLEVIMSSNEEMLGLFTEFSKVSSFNPTLFLLEDNDHGTILHSAVLHSTPAFFETLLASKLLAVDSMDSIGRTSLCLAMMNTQTSKVLSLLAAGASLKQALTYRDSTGQDLIHRMVVMSQKLFLSLLVLHCPDMNRRVTMYQEEEGVTALHMAAMIGGREIINLLLRAGSDVKCRTMSGKLPSDLAQEKGHYDISRYLRKLDGKNCDNK